MMRNFPNLILAAVLFVSRCLLAQDAGVRVIQQPAAAKVPMAGGSIIGKVVCADTHTPARGARIVVQPLGATRQAEEKEPTSWQPHMAITALDGTFQVLHLPPGEYAVITLAAGYLSPLDGVMLPLGVSSNSSDREASDALLREKAPLVRISGRETARVDIELPRGAILTGKVVYSDGSPATGLRVLLQHVETTKREGQTENRRDTGAMMRGMFEHQTPKTDDQGHFRIPGIPGGLYRLAVIQNFEVGLNLGEEMFADLNPSIPPSDKLAVYSGNTFHRKDAKVYELRPGDTVDGIEVVLPLTGLHSVQGVATGKDGAPLNFGLVSLSDTADSNIKFHNNIRAGGEFRFSGIPEGIYEIKIIGGQIIENPPNFELIEEQMPAIQARFKPLRAFAETKVAVTVQTTDVDDLAILLADTKLPERAVPAADPETSPENVVVHPQ
jgi:hypothetical protein